MFFFLYRWWESAGATCRRTGRRSGCWRNNLSASRRASWSIDWPSWSATQWRAARPRRLPRLPATYATTRRGWASVAPYAARLRRAKARRTASEGHENQNYQWTFGRFGWVLKVLLMQIVSIWCSRFNVCVLLKRSFFKSNKLFEFTQPSSVTLCD